VRGLTFRARLTWAIVAEAVIGGSVLLTAEYFVVQSAFRLEVRGVQIGNARPPDDGSGSSPLPLPLPLPLPSSSAPPSDSAGTVTAVQQSVLSTMLVASTILLGLFALIAGLVAWWLAGRVTSRVAAITDLTRDVSGRDLHSRLSLSGPRDEIRELGDTIDAMLARLEDAFERQKRFIANASHELRTPLTATRTALEAPLVQGRFPADVVPAVQRALAATDRGSQLITALLGLARTEAGPASIGEQAEREASRLDELVVEICRRWQTQARERSVSFNLDVRPIVVSGHPTLLAQAVENLIGNAVRHGSADAAIDVVVCDSGERDGGTSLPLALLEVANGGAVMSDADVAQLVEPFHRGQLSRLSGEPGSGLGLSLVDAVARHHHGQLDLRPRVGGGLVVRILIPVGDQKMDEG
jgi:signal transduction histidine kinase